MRLFKIFAPLCIAAACAAAVCFVGCQQSSQSSAPPSGSPEGNVSLQLPENGGEEQQELALPQFFNGTTTIRLEDATSISLSKSYASSSIKFVNDADDMAELLDYFRGVEFTEGDIDVLSLCETPQDLWQVVAMTVFTPQGSADISVYKGNTVVLVSGDKTYHTEPGAVSEGFRELVHTYCPY